jgi:transcriptional regulator with XRE-family HTH domain
VALTQGRRNDPGVADRDTRATKEAELARIFGENIARLREAANLSQEDLAYRSSIHYSTIYLLEAGRRQPRLATLVRLIGALGIEPNELLEGLQWKPPVEGPGIYAGDRFEQDDR